MNIIITGGYGTLGCKVAKKLINLEHDVYIVDPQGSEDDLAPLEELFPAKTHGKFLCSHAGMIANKILGRVNKKVDVIIHLAETLNTEQHLDPNIISSNITDAAHVLYMCAATGIQCIYPTWQFKPPIQSSLLAMTLHEKSRLPSYYGIGNALIKTIELPFLIDFDTPGINLYSFPSKVYNSIMYGWPIVAKDYEYIEDVMFQWTTTDIAAREIVEAAISTKGRSTTSLPRQYTSLATQKEVIKSILDNMNVNGFVEIIRQKLEPIIIERSENGRAATSRIRKWIGDAINTTTDRDRGTSL